MKIKEFIGFLEKYDGELEIMRFEDELGEYFPIEIDYMEGSIDVYETDDGNTIKLELAKEIFDENEFDKNLTKVVFAI